MKYSFADELAYSCRLDLTASDRRTLNRIGQGVVKGSRREIGNTIIMTVRDREYGSSRRFKIEVGEDNKIKTMSMDPGGYDSFVKLTKKETGGKSLTGYIIRLNEIIVFKDHKIYYYYGEEIGNQIPREISNPKCPISIYDYLRAHGIKPDASRFIEFPNTLLENITLYDPERSILDLKDYINANNKRTVTRRI